VGIVYPAGVVNAEVIRGDEVKILNYAFLVILFPIPDPHHKMAIIMESNSPKQLDGN